MTTKAILSIPNTFRGRRFLKYFRKHFNYEKYTINTRQRGYKWGKINRHNFWVRNFWPKGTRIHKDFCGDVPLKYGKSFAVYLNYKRRKWD